MLFEERIELMRKAKYAALVFGGVSTCIFGGLLGVYATSPVVSTVAPKNDVQNIYEVESDELANVAAVTSIRTTPVTTTSNTYRSVSYTTAAVNYETVTTTSATTNYSYTYSASVKMSAKAPVIASAYAETTASFAQQTTAANAAWGYAVTTVNATTVATSYEYAAPTTEPVTEPINDEPVQTTEFIVTEPDYNFVTEPVTEAPVVDVVTPAVTEPVLSITDEEFIILCNAVAHEAGCYWIDEYDKAKVVEVIMNRVNSPLYPNTVLGVLTQPYQFSGSSSYVYLGTYSSHVTDSVINAVQLYFNEPSSFTHGYFGFYGDGYRNYFY